MRNRTFAALMALLLAGCVTPAGIVDDWRPPQAEGTSEEQRVICAEGDTPCETQVTSLNKTRQTGAKKPSPPRKPRR